MPAVDPLIAEDVSVIIGIYYASRPDLDESLILDCMQGLVYKNDRQVKEKHVIWGGVDRTIHGQKLVSETYRISTARSSIKP